jgi:hypothetical protein
MRVTIMMFLIQFIKDQNAQLTQFLNGASEHN